VVIIKTVEKSSPSYKAGIRAEDRLLAINGHEITDVLDYRFYLTEKKIVLKLERDGETFEKTIRKGEYDDIGLDFETFLMSEKRRCQNKCIFCFIDQLPEGMRDTLYFKDDDSRLSFLMGNYITLTNLKEKDIDRIIQMKMSPVNISVHTTDPDLRVMMTGNKNAGSVLSYLNRLAEGGIEMNFQIVLCKGVNDGEHLEKTMHDLAILHPAAKSISVVPAGLTRFREGLYPLSPYTPEAAGTIIGQVSAFAAACRKAYGKNLFYCADELYLKAGLPLPSEEDYDEYPQLENGVGLIRSMETEFQDELEYLDEYDLDRKRKLTIATGEAAYDFIRGLVEALKKKSPNLEATVVKITNCFFGETITVAGLMTGYDLYTQLKDHDLGEFLLLPASCTESSGTFFLDNMSVTELENKLNIKIVQAKNDGREFIEKVLY